MTDRDARGILLGSGCLPDPKGWEASLSFAVLFFVSPADQWVVGAFRAYDLVDQPPRCLLFTGGITVIELKRRAAIGAVWSLLSSMMLVVLAVDGFIFLLVWERRSVVS